MTTATRAKKTTVPKQAPQAEFTEGELPELNAEEQEQLDDAKAVVENIKKRRLYAKSVTYPAIQVLTRCNMWIGNKVVHKNFPNPAYQRGNESFNLKVKQGYMDHILTGGNFRAIDTWSDVEGKIKEVIDGKQRLQCLALVVEAMYARKQDPECLINPVVQSALDRIKAEGLTAWGYDEIVEVPWYVLEHPAELTYDDREALFIVLNNGIPIKQAHLTDLGQREIIEMATAHGIRVVTQATLTETAVRGRKTETAEEKAAKHAYKSATVVEVVAAYLAKNPKVKMADMKSHKTSDELKKKIDKIGEKETFTDIYRVLYGTAPFAREKYGSEWKAVKDDSPAFLAPLTAALGNARDAKREDIVNSHVEELNGLLNSKPADPLAIVSTLLPLYNGPKNSGDVKRKMVFHGMLEMFKNGVHVDKETEEPVEGMPINWAEAATKA